MDQNQSPPKKKDPVTEPPKPGYSGSGDDGPLAPLRDEPVTDPPKPGYHGEGE